MRSPSYIFCAMFLKHLLTTALLSVSIARATTVTGSFQGSITPDPSPPFTFGSWALTGTGTNIQFSDWVGFGLDLTSGNCGSGGGNCQMVLSRTEAVANLTTGMNISSFVLNGIDYRSSFGVTNSFLLTLTVTGPNMPGTPIHQFNDPRFNIIGYGFQDTAYAATITLEVRNIATNALVDSLVVTGGGIASASISNNTELVLLNYNNFSGETSTVPEPGTVGMIGAASALLLLRMRRSK